MIPLEESLAEIPFPVKGRSDAISFDQMDGAWTPDGENVRVFESLTSRGRGGSRAGISRYIDAQVSGANAIQHLNTVVRTEGNALGWHFLGVEFELTGLYDGVDLDGSTDEPDGGGGGYLPSGASFNGSRPHLSLTASATTAVVGDSVTITGLTVDDEDDPLANKTVRLNTSRGSNPGDGAVGDTDSAGEKDFSVTADQAGTVTYIGTIEDSNGNKVTRSRNTVKITWTEPTMIEFIQIHNTGGNGPVLSNFTFPIAVQAGDLIIGMASDPDGIVSLADNFGTVYTQVDRPDPPGPDVPSIMWYGIAAGSGSLTLTATFGDASQQGLNFAHYRGTASAPTATVYSSGTGTAWTTGDITVAANDSLLVAWFLSDSHVGLPFVNLTADAGFTKRQRVSYPFPNGIADRSLICVDGLLVDVTGPVTGTADFAKNYTVLAASFAPGV